MKKRKFLSLFAILFVAIFALSVCFFAACKDKDEEGVDDATTEQGDETGEGGDGTGTENEGTGTDDEDEEEPRTGSSITGGENIIGTWTGDVTIRAELGGYGGTIESEMTVVITADDGFTLSFATNSITYDSIVGLLGLEDYVNGLLEDAGILGGEDAFEMFSGMPVYEDETGYFVDIDGDYTTCQVSLEVVDGLLCIDFDETMTFGSFPIEIIFDAKLYSEAELAIEKIIDLAGAEDALTYTTTVGEAVFVNDEDLSIRTTDGINYAVSGPASKMGEAEVAYYEDASIEEGALYVVLKISVPENGSITFGYSQKTYVNSSDGDTDEFDEDGYIYVIQALRDEDGDGVYDERDFTIKDANENETKYTVTFEGVNEPAEKIEWVVTMTADKEDIIDGMLTLEVGDTVSLEGTAVTSEGDSHGLYTDSTWTSSNPEVASVEIDSLFGVAVYRDATLTAVGAGTTEITFTIPEGASLTITVVVNAPLVKIYEGEAELSADSGTSVTFANAHDLAVYTTTDENGTVCSVEGMATFMTEEQSAALNDDDTNYTAFVVIEIPAATGSTITYGNETITVAADATSAVIVQGLTAEGNETVSVKVGEDTEFTISFDKLTVPGYAIEGERSGTVTATVTFDGTEYENATMSIELTVAHDGSLSFVISDIDLNDDTANASLSANVMSISFSGTWSVGDDGSYTITVTAKTGSLFSPSIVSVPEDAVQGLEKTSDEESEETQIKISFGVKYEYKKSNSGEVLATVEITVTDAVLDME